MKKWQLLKISEYVTLIFNFNNSNCNDIASKESPPISKKLSSILQPFTLEHLQAVLVNTIL